MKREIIVFYFFLPIERLISGPSHARFLNRSVTGPVIIARLGGKDQCGPLDTVAGTKFPTQPLAGGKLVVTCAGKSVFGIHTDCLFHAFSTTKRHRRLISGSD
jgi:hypothetical protein